MRSIHVITGQTASGKTSYALMLAKKDRHIELISADSRQIYKELNIVTGKDIPNGSVFHLVENAFRLNNNRYADIGYYLIDGVKLWGTDFVQPNVQFSSHDYALLANHIITRYFSKKSVPYLVGGSYLYIKHMLYGFDVSIPPDWNLRKKLVLKPLSEIQSLLIKLDEDAYMQLNNSDRHNPHRLIRKIEIATGKIKNANNDKKNPSQSASLKYRAGTITAIAFKDKSRLHDCIKQRVLARIEQGAIEETKALLNHRYKLSNPGLQTIGYRELLSYIGGRIDYNTAIEHWTTAEIQYAKRQLAFIKQNIAVNWLYAENLKEVER